jgi:hypothetical protein
MNSIGCPVAPPPIIQIKQRNSFHEDEPQKGTNRGSSPPSHIATWEATSMTGTFAISSSAFDRWIRSVTGLDTPAGVESAASPLTRFICTGLTTPCADASFDAARHSISSGFVKSLQKRCEASVRRSGVASIPRSPRHGRPRKDWRYQPHDATGAAHSMQTFHFHAAWDPSFRYFPMLAARHVFPFSTRQCHAS